MNQEIDYQKYYEELIALRRDFHAHPELGLQEFRTAEIIENYLIDLGLEVRRCTETGVIGVLRTSRPGKTVMLRADIDALPIQEETGLPFASQNPGVMHACGHDTHISMLLVAAKILTAQKEKLQGTIVFLFQPNEEDAGAQLMIDAGAMENPKPDAITGIHITPYCPTGTIGWEVGPFLASSYYFKIRIHGQAGHAAYPLDTRNPIDAAAKVLEATKYFSATETTPFKPTTVTICKIHAGTSNISVPDTLEMEGSFRCLHEDDQAARERYRELVKDVCRAFRCSCEMEYKCGNSLLLNDENLASLLEQTAAEVIGKDARFKENLKEMGGDDFAEFLQHCPGVYYYVGAGPANPEQIQPAHSSTFDIDEKALIIGVEMHVELACRVLES